MIRALLEELRPWQWTKNLLLYAGLLFSRQLGNPELLLRATAGFVAFSLLSGTVYVINDLADVQADRRHPTKRLRPIASGRLPVAMAQLELVPLLGLTLAISAWLGRGFSIVAWSYFALNLAYSFGLKKQVLIDVFVVAIGFVMRAIAGVELLRPVSPGTELSPWLLVCTFFGALFLGLAKRRREVVNAGGEAQHQREVLEHYSLDLVDALLLVSAAASVMGYALYTIWPATVAKFHTEALLYTVPFVAYGIFRYLYLVRVSDSTEDPANVLLTDRPLAACVLLYLVAVLIILYRFWITVRRRGGVIVEARAKLNLGLAVGPRRADGYHDLATVFQSVSLADHLIARPAARGFTLRVRHERAAARGGRGRPGAVPVGRDNLVLRAARLLARQVGLEGGARFELVKRIPAGAGLGGGSADAAAALTALAALHRVRLPPSAWRALAVELGADVPFALLGGTALGLGRGERLRRLRLESPFRVLIAVPAWRVETRAAYAQIDRNKYGLTGWSAKLRFAQSLGRKSLSPVHALRLGNSFESVLGRREADFVSLRSRLERVGVGEVHLTGSGSAVFGLVPPRMNVARALSGFVGTEALYEARSTQGALRLRTS